MNLVGFVLSILFLSLGGVIGWFACLNWGAKTVQRPVKHQAADDYYIVFQYDGEPAAFTVEAVAYAQARAYKLNLEPQRGGRAPLLVMASGLFLFGVICLYFMG